ncbi:MAG: cytochrome D1 domain-containing protein, partial [Pseudolabrys sp.]
MIAVDKMGAEVLFLNPSTYKIEKTLKGFPRTVHELLVVPETGTAYVPIFGDGIHGRNPNPGHLLCVIDLKNRAHVADIDLRPYIAPHTLKLGPDGLIYITCENSAVVALIDRSTNTVVDAIDSGSANGHRLIIAPDGRRLYTENEEDCSVSVIDLPARKLLGKISTPRALAGITISPDGRTVVAVDDVEPTLFLIDAADEKIDTTVRLEDVPEAAQIARYSPDNSVIAVTSLKSNTVSLIDPSFKDQVAIKV